MKSVIKGFWIILACLISHSLFAQLHLKVSPLGLTWTSPEFSVEYALRPNVGLELNAGANAYWLNRAANSYRWTQGANLNLRYYLSPTQSLDGWYVGHYARAKIISANLDDRQRAQAVALGALVGFQDVSGRLVCDFTFGGGYKVYHKFPNSGWLTIGLYEARYDVFARATLGYRLFTKDQ